METYMNKFDPKACAVLAEEAMAALAPVAEKHGLTLVREAGRYDSSSFSFKAKFTTTTDEGAPADFARNARMLGLPEDCWGREIGHRGETVKIVGFAMRRRKYPVVVKKSDGKDLLLTVDGVLGQLALADVRARQASAS